jgi:precorrin-8X/cobalt-precorrin-8 methylmutase
VALMESLTMKPEEIETESFRIIDCEAGEHGWPEPEWQIVRRAIHTSADFEYAQSMILSDDVVDEAIAALTTGAGIVTDTNIALSGIRENLWGQV